MQVFEYTGEQDMAQEVYERQAQFFSALSHPVRLRIIDILAQGDACVCHLSTALQQRQAYVSQQLAKLREAGLITDQKEGLYVYYRLADEEIAQLLHEARQCLVSLTGDQSLLRVQVPAHGEFDCPCPRCQTRLSNL
jgi:DNA-binding transcriptional ArsR family regulator